MIDITEKNKEKCCGCTACANICPKNVIKMQEDEEGFLYPVVDKEKCVQCGLCDKVCPIKNKEEKENKNIQEAYALRTNNSKDLKTSTSGGFFTPLAKKILEKKGVVFGVGYDGDLKIIHKKIVNNSGIKELRGSKYIQSFLGDTFKQIKKELEEEMYVLFTGTPCQVYGLKKYLKKEYDNLITMDLICHGVPSPKLWKNYIEYQENKYKSKIKKVYFRNKTYGYHSGTMKLEFNSGKKYYGSARIDYMLKSFFSEISSRPSCYNCQFKTDMHPSDFTVYDCWSYEKLTELKDDDKGYTNLLINTEKGKRLYKEIRKEFYSVKVNIRQAIEYDGIMVEKSAIPHKKRKEFYKYMNEKSLEEAVKKFIPVSIKDKIIENLKPILCRIGAFKIKK